MRADLVEVLHGMDTAAPAEGQARGAVIVATEVAAAVGSRPRCADRYSSTRERAQYRSVTSSKIT